MRDCLLAVSTLTALPVRVTWPAGERTDAPGYYPLVGAMIGGVGYGAARFAGVLGWSARAPLVVAAMVVTIFAISTRVLHWDGLADVADSFGAPERVRRLEIMKDSATGAFGVTAVVLGVLLETAAIALLLTGSRTWALVAVPVLGRLAATFAAWFGAPARSDGLGASVIGTPRVGGVVPVLLTLVALAWSTAALLGAPGIWLCVAGVALALVIPHVMSLRFGGVTGDVMGASIVLVETVLFVALAVAAG